jgi:Na+-transporting methylmalonyl-CoA/oxaloacetate decarboxylase gamma subunit
MNLQDALTISALGLSVVFGGLTLTALLIFVLGTLPSLAARLRPPARRRSGSPEEPLPQLPIDPAVITVIATVLEVERRLHRAEHGGRLTIERTL